MTVLQFNERVYEAIIRRRSIRRYKKEEVDPALQGKILKFKSKIVPLEPENQFDYTIHRVKDRPEGLVEILGLYGKIADCPHFILPLLRGQKHVHEDLGFRMQQLVIYLTELGIATCYIGSAHREEKVREMFDLGEDERITAFILFGYPDERLEARQFEEHIWRNVGARNKKPLEQILFKDTFGNPFPLEELEPRHKKVFEAARNTPSAVNTQPWRFIFKDGKVVYLAVQRGLQYHKKLGAAVGEKYKFCLTDAGIVMGNFMLASRVYGFQGNWELIADEGERKKISSLLALPSNFYLVASSSF
ncbi:MAG: hypothetical protein GX767_00670 [Firmicutes bacterium]|nr:hypothetical protein [Bacillota bacterium]